MLTAYSVGLLGDEEETAQANLVLGTDVKCDMTRNVCEALQEGPRQQIISLQSALNRANTYFDFGFTPVELDGVIGPATLAMAVGVSQALGAEAHPAIAEITKVDVYDKAQVGALAERLATAPIGFQNAFDEVTSTARESAHEAGVKAQKNRKIYWILGTIAVVGLAVGGIYYVRKRSLELAPA
jgi:hypothetical protein